MDVYKSLTGKTAISLDWNLMERAATELQRTPEGRLFLNGLAVYPPTFTGAYAEYPLFEHLIVFLYLRHFVPLEFGSKWTAFGTTKLNKIRMTSLGEAIDVILFHKMLPDSSDVPHQLSFIQLCNDKNWGFADDRILLQRMWFIRAYLIYNDGISAFEDICWFDYRLTIVIYCWVRHNRRYQKCANEYCECSDFVANYGIRRREFARIYKLLDKLLEPVIMYTRSNKSAWPLETGDAPLSRAVHVGLYVRFHKEWPLWFTSRLMDPENGLTNASTLDTSGSNTLTNIRAEESSIVQLPVQEPSDSITPDVESSQTVSIVNAGLAPATNHFTVITEHNAPLDLAEARADRNLTFEQSGLDWLAKEKVESEAIRSASSASTSKEAEKAPVIQPTRGEVPNPAMSIVDGQLSQLRPHNQRRSRESRKTVELLNKNSETQQPERMQNPESGQSQNPIAIPASRVTIIDLTSSPPESSLRTSTVHPQHREPKAVSRKRTREEVPASAKESGTAANIVEPKLFSLGAPPTKRMKMDTSVLPLKNPAIGPTSTPTSHSLTKATDGEVQSLQPTPATQAASSTETIEQAALASVVTAFKRLVEVTDEDAVSTAGTSTSSKSKSSSNTHSSPGAKSSSGKKLVLGRLKKDKHPTTPTKPALHHMQSDSVSSVWSESLRLPNPSPTSSRSSSTIREVTSITKPHHSKTASLPEMPMGMAQSTQLPAPESTDPVSPELDQNDAKLWDVIKTVVPTPAIYVHCPRPNVQLLSSAHEARRLVCLLIGLGIPLDWASVDPLGYGIMIRSEAVASLLSVIRQDSFNTLRSAGVSLSLTLPPQEQLINSITQSKPITLETLGNHETLVSITDTRADRRLRDHAAEHSRLAGLVRQVSGSLHSLEQPTSLDVYQSGDRIFLTLDEVSSNSITDVAVSDLHQLGLAVYRGKNLLTSPATEMTPVASLETQAGANPVFDWRALRTEVLKMKLPWETDGDNEHIPSPYQRWIRGMASFRWSASSSTYSTMATAGLRWSPASFSDSEEEEENVVSTGSSGISGNA
ncbi:hypothetical protein PIIN_07109 [Serendipita indica DSM 11827]|uniref:Uncharacterized protein n=1 Tax=Serendipita indica (strain DSM 11827) TaxID=1109443 RepID=G4TPB2_SERID|nr:hypothetical protein PIIN_07109 [Serendipita indica DSM 11827]